MDLKSVIIEKPLEITPERARIVNETVWEVVTSHPHTALRKATSPEQK